jgi:hypothetical protein
MRRPLPTESEAREILARRRTRPPPRPAPRAGQALNKTLRALDEKYGRGADALEARWKEIVGERLARVTQPQKLTKGRGNAGGTLELRVAGSAALLIQHQSAEIIERVNLFLGKGAVEKLRIAQGPVRGLSDSPAAPRRAQAPTPLPAEQEAALEKSVIDAPSGLQQALIRLGRQVMRRRQDR